jgi:DNA replication protein DnaC
MAENGCPQCDGTGWKPVEAEGLHRVVRCGCTAVKHVERLLRQTRIPKRYEHCSFENFDIRKDKETGQENFCLRWARNQAEKFVEEYPVDFGLRFVGPTGVGKTHLAVAVVRELALRKGVECLFCDFRDLLKEIRESYNPISETSEFGVLEPVLDVEVLLLDELVAACLQESLSPIWNGPYTGLAQLCLPASTKCVRWCNWSQMTTARPSSRLTIASTANSRRGVWGSATP